RIESFRGDSKLSTWLYRVATNHCKNRIKYLGRRARGKKKELDEIADASAIESATMSTSAQLPRPDEALAGRQIESFVQQALVALSNEQRELVVLRDIENMTYEELQTVTGLAAGTVKSRLHRARLALAQKVRELQNEAKP
ncbi:MAG: sigma-70 family RNA polymerase sigma factor, partial [Myxococcota bacterium]